MRGFSDESEVRHIHHTAKGALREAIDAAGTCNYAYSSFGELQSEDGPWDNDTVTYSYTNQLRSSLSLQAPSASPWVQSYGYDAASRLNSLTSPAGTFGYQYQDAGRLIQKLSLPPGAYITNSFDP